MKKIKSREEFLSENDATSRIVIITEDVEVDICVEDDAKDMLATVQGVDGVRKSLATDFGVIRATVAKKIIDLLKGLEGVEDVREVTKK